MTSQCRPCATATFRTRTVARLFAGRWAIPSLCPVNAGRWHVRPGREVLAVAAVVSGRRPQRLTGWRLDDAVAAMHALGHPLDVTAERLRATEATVAKVAAALGLVFVTEPDLLAVEFVSQGTPMRLRGADLDEVLRRLGPTRTTSEIARLTDSRTQTIAARAKKLGVELRPHVPWSYAGRPARQPVAA